MDTFDRKLDYICPTNQTIAGIRSQHNNGAEDIVFEIICRFSAGRPSRFQWNGTMNISFSNLYVYTYVCYKEMFCYIRVMKYYVEF